MLRNYLTVALRTFQREKFYTSLNVIGLAVGMACALLIISYVSQELRYDHFHSQADRLYRVNLDYNWNGEEGIGGATPPPVAEHLAADYPEVEATTRLYAEGNTLVRYGDRSFDEDNIVAVDSNFFALFSFPLLAGDPATVLAQPNNIVLTTQTARRYFGEEDPIGKTLILWENYQVSYRVSGVVADPPAHSHITFDMLIPLENHYIIERFSWSWIKCQFATYALLQEGADVSALEAKIPAMVAQYGAKVLEQFIGSTYEDFIKAGGRWFFVFQPLTDVYLHSTQKGNLVGPLGNATYVTILMVVAVLVLLIACINFMNLATARAAQRSQEVGIRKALGGQSSQLRGQFLAEALLYALLALLVALILTELMRIGLLSLTQIVIPSVDRSLLITALLLAVGVGLLSGSYPAFYLSSFAPVQALKGARRGSGGHQSLRKGLVTGQFAVSIVLIVCTLLVQRQLAYVQNTALGFDQENVLVISYAERLGNQLSAFRQALAGHSEVLDVALSTSVPGQDYFMDFYNWRGANVENRMLSSLQGDYDYLTTLGMRMVSGRYFSRDFPTDTAGVVLNETAIRQLELEDPVGQTFSYPGACGDCTREFTILGVVEDFHMNSLHNPIEPFAIFLYHPKNYHQDNHRVVLRVAPGQAPEAIKLAEVYWQQYKADSPLTYSFLDQDYDRLFRSEQQLGTLFGIFASLTVLIACLGLLGLVAYTVNQRTKEIGIRKTLGASVAQVVRLLSVDFIKLLLLAFGLAAPIAFLLVQRWLQQFAYHTDVGIDIFILAGAVTLLVAGATISIQSVRAALANPVDSLRDE